MLSVRGGRQCQKFCLFCVVPILLSLFCCASDTLQVYRLLQYDYEGKQYGSRQASLNHYVTLAMEGSQLLGSVVILPMWQFTDEQVKELLQGALRLAGLIIVLPANDERELLLDRQLAHQVYKAEQWLFDETIPIPVYFTLQNSATKLLIQDLQAKIKSGVPPSVVTGGYKTIVSAKKPNLVKDEKGFANIIGWLYGSDTSSGDVFRSGNPTVAIVADYDAWSAVPGLAFGANSNASGVVILLQLMKMFSKLYSYQESRPYYNMLFMLTSGGAWNYAGTQHWLDGRADPSLLESIEVAVCLDSLGRWSQNNQGQVNMIYSKPAKEESVKQIYDTFTDTAQLLEIPLNQVHKKINISADSVAHQHEHFNKKRILGITLSGRDEQSIPTTFDREPLVDNNSLLKVSQFIGQAISNLIFEDKVSELTTFDSNMDSDSHFLRQMLNMLTMTSRFAPMNMPLKEGLVPALKGKFETYLKGVKLDTFGLDKRIRLYDAQIQSLKIVNMAGVLFDVFLLFGIVLMLLGLFASVRVYFFGFEELRRDLIVLTQPQARKGGKKR
eukprot:TRINITY_DN7276_c0_g1_i1.p1 TRINITY_DN7276_c0_g1~~TRINITY_DN7276_c0_g1_i1.p1  ORF type:complete len:564 (-),score=44.65 TRINITY_DN7276_c0_g1_i1:148-1812(-)